jgi:hypothetical protein
LHVLLTTKKAQRARESHAMKKIGHSLRHSCIKLSFSSRARVPPWCGLISVSIRGKAQGTILMNGS